MKNDRKSFAKKRPEGAASEGRFERTLRRSGRRGFMKMLAQIGISGATLATLTEETLAETVGDPRKEVPYIESYEHTNHREIVEEGATPKREPKYTTVSRDRWVTMQGAKKARRQVARQFRRNRNVSVSVTFDDPGSSPRPRVTVQLETPAGERPAAPDRGNRPAITRQEARERAPQSVVATVGDKGFERETDPIPVEVAETATVEQEYFDDTYRPVPGGPLCDDTSLSSSSVATAAYSSAVSDFGWVTAGHVVNWDTGTQMGQPTPSDRIGESAGPILGDANSPYSRDAAFVQEDGPPYATFQIADDSGGTRNFSVYGAATENKLYGLAATGETVYLQGPMSGNRSTTVRGVAGDGSGTMEATNVQLDYPTKNGDSGGSYYWKETSDKAKILGVHAWGRDPDGDGFVEFAEGNAMWAIEAELDLTA